MNCAECRKLAFACPETQAEVYEVFEHLASCDACHAWHKGIIESKTTLWVKTNPVQVKRLKKFVRTHCCGCEDCKVLIRGLTSRFGDAAASGWLKTMILRVVHQLTRDLLFGSQDPDFDTHLQITVHRMLEDHEVAGHA